MAMLAARSSPSCRIQLKFAALPFEIPLRFHSGSQVRFSFRAYPHIPKAWAIHKLGTLPEEQFKPVMAGRLRWLGQTQV
jgi:hypothetical protein